jgi:hypothetical protein
MKTLFSSATLNKRLFLLIFGITTVLSTVRAGGLWPVAGARQAGMDHCSVALTGLWSVENNLAGMTSIQQFSAGMAFQNRYLSPHLGIADLAVVYPSPFGKLGVSMRYFGYSLFHEMKIGISYARLLGKKIRVGVQLDYLQTAFGDVYGSKSNFTFALGLQSPVTQNLTLGIYVYNPIPVKLADYTNEKIPAVFRLGLAYAFSKNLLVTAEAEKNTAFRPVIVRAGMEYRFHQQFFFRLGLATSGDVFAIGLGWQTKKLRVDIASTMHATLGFSPQASLEFTF